MKTVTKILSITAVGLVIVGCGGGNGSSSNSISQAEVEIITNTTKVAYQKGNGEWMDDLTKEILSNGKIRYTFKVDGKYGVAFKCTIPDKVAIFQLTTKESKKVYFSCSNFKLYSHVKGAVSDQAGVPDGYAVAMEREYYIINSSSGNYDFTNGVPYGKRDLVSTSLKKVAGNKIEPVQFLIKRDIPIQTSSKTIDIVFKTTNSCDIDSYPFLGQSGTQASAYYITKNDTYFLSSLNDKWYIPQNYLVNDDLYVFYAKYSTNLTSMVDVKRATEVKKGAKSYDLTYINKFTSAVYDKNSATLSGLNYQSSTHSQKLKAYLAMIKKNTGNKYIDLVLSKDWLNGDSEYTIPNLNTLNSFQNAWLGQQPDKVSVKAIMSNRSIENMVSSEKVFTPDGVNLFINPGIKYEVALDKIF